MDNNSGFVQVKKGSRGFTIIEVLIAISIFAIGILAVASMQISAVQGHGKSNAKLETQRFMTEQVELLMAEDFATFDAISAQSGAPEGTVSYGGYTVQWDIFVVDSGTGSLVTPTQISNEDVLVFRVNALRVSSGKNEGSITFVRARDV